ncbi:MAG TPA: N-acetylmuramoyl-L-alanine amidase [Candidatus Eremiobacteraceae bacterium]
MLALLQSGRPTIKVGTTSSSLRPTPKVGPTLIALVLAVATASPAAAQSQVWVAGRQIAFDKLTIAYGDPVVTPRDAGLHAMLDAVSARMAWQPGTRFVAITRADGQLITFTIGSNAVFVNGAATAIPFAPFSRNGDLYLPLLPLARALGLGVRGFHGGYVFVPQIETVNVHHDGVRTVVHVQGSAQIAWRSTYEARAAAHTLTFSFPGFGTDLTRNLGIRDKVVLGTTISESGPPGYPTTSISLALAGKAKFAAHRSADGVGMDIYVARGETGLRVNAPAATPSAVTMVGDVTVSATTIPAGDQGRTQATSSPAPPPSPIAVPEPVDTSSAAAVATAQPMPQPSAQASTPPMVEQKITDVSVAQVPTGTRITLTFDGPVTFEWHRLGDPDNRFWLDVDRAVLVGPAQDLDVKLDFIKSVRVSQHLLTPDKVVRVSIAPSRGTDIRIGQVAGTTNQLGIEIESAPPSPDAPMAGTGFLSTVVAVQSPPSPVMSAAPVATRGDLIVLDPGHGGNDPGSINADLGLTEKNLTLTIAKIVESRLRSAGWRVVMTRDGDYEVGDPNGIDRQELQARCDVANAAGATAFVSIHINASVSTTPNGTTTYYWRPADKAFAQDVQSETVNADGIVDAGVKREDFYVIKHTQMPAVLVETAYLSNAHDGAMLQQPAFLDRIAAGIVKGIMDFTGGPKAPPPTPGPSP